MIALKDELPALIIYHAGCMDGQGALAAAVYSLVGSTAPVDAWSANYGQEPPYEKAAGKDVYVLDFCYTIEQMRKLRDVSARFTWIDHHDTTFDVLTDLLTDARANDRLVWSKEHSGAVLTWLTLVGDGMPDILAYIEDRDLWKWELPLSREISEGLAFMFNPGDRDAKKDPGIFSAGLLAADTDVMAMLGRTLLQSKAARVKRATYRAYPITIFEGLTVYAVNSTEDVSEVGEAVCEQYGCNAALIYYYAGPKKHWLCSLRSKDGTDVSALAAMYGGGGHKPAAGFSVDVLPFSPPLDGVLNADLPPAV